MKKFLFVSLLLVSIGVWAQPPAGGGGRRTGGGMTAGHFYGKIADSKTNKGIDGASVQLLTTRMDTATQKPKEVSVKTVISETNGDFSLENVPVFGNFKLKVSAVGFKTSEQSVSFGLKPQAGASPQDMMTMIDKDLGNVKLEVDAANLGNVTVTTTKRLFEMGVDRKIFNVDKNIVSSGQTATEVMKSIPSLSVDIDGNVTMRNSTPQLFVDGRPTTLTMDQIPADIIESVELITNPSAKFDASGGNAGILNIVLKKNKKSGYNGGLRAGTDTRGGYNLGGDLNLRQNKINFFASGNLNSRRSKGTSTTDRTNYATTNTPQTSIYQTSNPFSKNLFGFIRGGFDYFIDNRNTITVAGNYVHGNNNSDYDQRTDSLITVYNLFSAYNAVRSNNEGNFKNVGSQLSFKHNFEKNGHYFTADANYSKSNNDNNSRLLTYTYGPTNSLKKAPVDQNTIGSGETENLTVQTDYSNPITDKQKFEAGVRASIRDVNTLNNQYFFNDTTKIYDLSARLSSNYQYTDKVYAAYATYSLKLSKWSYQFGLRAESSVYTGTVVKNDSSFSVKYPLSLFPSAFITYSLSDKEDLQFNYSRRINRPNFFQILPFIDYSDPQNLSVGNAGLKPEFTNSLEISYNNSYSKGSNFLTSVFLKQNSNLITRYQYKDVNPDTKRLYSTSDSAIFNTYLNANNSVTYGIELTNRIPLFTWWDNTTNFNLFNSSVTVTDPTGKTADLKNQRTSWFAKMNNSFKLPKNFAVQLSGEYFAKTVLPSEGGRGGGGGQGGRGGGGGGMNFGGGQSGTAQGYINPRYSFDIAIRKDFTWKGGNSASVSLSMNDFLRTQLYSTYSESPFLKQLSERRRDPQILRLNFNYRFGKFDVNLFKRKNDRTIDSGDTMPQ